MEFSEIINKRRSVNFFDTTSDVSDDTLRAVIEDAAKTPSSFNLQPWNLIAVRSDEEKKRLRKLAWDQPKVEEAPVVLIVLADRDGWKEGHEIVERNFREMVAAGNMQEEQRQWFLDAAKGLYGRSDEASQAFALKNAGFFGMSLMYAATARGLDTHPMDGFDHDGVKAAFDIPDRYWIPLLLAVGHFDRTKKLLPPKWRKDFDEIVLKTL